MAAQGRWDRPGCGEGRRPRRPSEGPARAFELAGRGGTTAGEARRAGAETGAESVMETGRAETGDGAGDEARPGGRRGGEGSRSVGPSSPPSISTTPPPPPATATATAVQGSRPWLTPKAAAPSPGPSATDTCASR